MYILRVGFEQSHGKQWQPALAEYMRQCCVVMQLSNADAANVMARVASNVTLSKYAFTYMLNEVIRTRVGPHAWHSVNCCSTVRRYYKNDVEGFIRVGSHW